MKSITRYYKTAIALLMILAIESVFITGCMAKYTIGAKEPSKTPVPVVNVEPIPEEETPEVPDEPEEVTEGTKEGLEDGEKFDDVIIIEGMDETVHYEHVKNIPLGFEMNYEYDRFSRLTSPVSEIFVSIYDDPEDPVNYLEVSASDEDAEKAASSVIKSLSETYDVLREDIELEKAGKAILLDASVAKGNNVTPDLIMAVYIVPQKDGCNIATAHYSFESAEGFGRRFRYMMNSFGVLDGAD